jgi:hypothetical protein
MIPGLNLVIERSQLRVGDTYYMDQSRVTKGVFVERDGYTIYFDCGSGHTYYNSAQVGREHLLPFSIEGAGFERAL